MAINVGLMIWVTTMTVILISILLYPAIIKIRRRSRMRRPDGLQVISSPEDARFELVAIHGLGADPEYTWTSKSEYTTSALPQHPGSVHLLRDLLREDFPDARILSFTYNSDWLFDAPITTAVRIADKLVGDLAHHRKRYSRIPIVFIGHSFGGIIIKEALCNTRNDARELVDSTCGIAFLGTPHFGSRMSRAGAFLAFVTRFLGSKTELLLALSNHKEQLTDLDRCFTDCMNQKRKRRQETEIISFWETKDTRLFSWLSLGVIVDVISARGGHGATASPISKDHSSLNKFSGKNDRSYQEFLEHLRKLEPAKSIAPTLNANQEFVVDRIGAVKGVEYDSYANEDHKCFGSTRHGILEQIEQWAQDSAREPIYWLQGKAGTGKSAIAGTVARNFAYQHCLGASFFFKRNQGERSKSHHLFPAIASQLAQRLPTVAEEMRNVLESNHGVAKKAPIVQFEQLILEPMRATHRDRTKAMIVVIDALDECDNDDDIKIIIGQLSRVSRPAQIPIRFFVTSRFEPPIWHGFQDIKGMYVEFALHEIPKDEVQEDIKAFLNHRLQQIRSKFSITVDWPGQPEFQKLLDMATPLFIFAATACRFLENGKVGGMPAGRLEMILKYHAMGSYDSAYLPVLNHMISDLTGQWRDDAICDFKNIVGSIVMLADPLPAPALARLLKTDAEYVDNRLEQLHSVLDISSNAAMPVRLFHESFRDFLIYPDKKNPHEFCIDKEATHAILTKNCLELLSNTGHLREDICKLGSPEIARDHVKRSTIDECLPSEIQYACLYWVYHSKENRTKLEDNGEAHRFLQCHFLHWLEALSLLGSLSEIIEMIHDLRSLIHSTNGDHLEAFLSDAERFALYFHAAINKTPLQVYYAGILFAPTTSIIRKMFSKHISNCVVDLPLLDTNWSQCIQILEGHSESVTSLTVSADGRHLASGSKDMTVNIWDMTIGARLQTLEGHESFVASLKFSADGQRLASGSKKTVKVWDVTTGTCLQTLSGHDNLCQSLTFLADGQRLMSCSAQNINIWNATTGTCLYTCSNYSQRTKSLSVVLSDDGQRLALSLMEGTIEIWDAITGLYLETLVGHRSEVWSMVFSVDGQYLASGSGDISIKIWNITQGLCLKTLLGHDGGVESVAFSANGQYLASGSPNQTVKVWDVKMGTCLQTLAGHGHIARSLAFSINGQRLILGLEDRTVQVWDVTTGTSMPTFSWHRSWVQSVVFSNNGQHLASCSEDRSIKLWDASTGTCLRTLGVNSYGNIPFAFSMDSQHLAYGSGDKTVKIWDREKGTCLQTLEGHENEVKAVAFSEDGQYLASGSYDMTIKIWDLTKGTCLRTLEGQKGWVLTVAFSPDGQYLASGTWDNIVKIWDYVKGTCLQTLQCYGRLVQAVAFSADGQYLAVSLDQRTVEVWNVLSSVRLQTLNVGRRISRLWFDPTANFRLFTNIGPLDLDLQTPLHVDDGQQTEEITRNAYPCGWGFSADGAWIVKDGCGIFWLPPEYRPDVSAVMGSKVAIGCSSGRVLFIRFS